MCFNVLKWKVFKCLRTIFFCVLIPINGIKQLPGKTKEHKDKVKFIISSIRNGTAGQYGYCNNVIFVQQPWKVLFLCF